MTGQKITAIWFRVLQPGEFYNIERHPRVTKGGNGSLYIEIPKSMTKDTLDFFEEPMPQLGGGGFTIEAVPVGSTDGTAFPITVMPKKGERLRIANQNRQVTPNRRHPAWSREVGFPIAPNSVMSKNEALPHFPAGGVRVFIAKLDDGSYLAGFTEGDTPPDTIAPGMPLRRLWVNKVVGGVLWDIDLPIADRGF